MKGPRIPLRISDDLWSLISICACYVSVASMPLLTMNAAYLAKLWYLLAAGAIGYLIVGPKSHSSSDVSSEIPHNNLTAVIEKVVKMAPKIDATGMVKKHIAKYHLDFQPVINEMKNIWNTGSDSMKNIYKSPVFQKVRSKLEMFMKNVTRLGGRNT